MKTIKFILFCTLALLTSELAAKTKWQVATFAGGCFWCVEVPFEDRIGIKSSISGYAGGIIKNPKYHDVARGKTKYREAVQVTYDPTKISYEDLLQIFWRNINPTDNGGQFVDRGFQYSSAIFYHSPSQKKEAEASKRWLARSGKFKKPIVTPIIKATTFYPAEDNHQDYYKKNPGRYKYYRQGSGRDQFLEKVWKDDLVYIVKRKNSFMKPTKSELKKTLTPIQFKVTQQDGTEPPFQNEFWNNKRDGIYVDVVSGEPLFSSTDKFKSGTGWPSFTRPLVEDNIVTKSDRKLWVVRTEVRSKNADSHLGHVFDDGPAPTGKRYCINSAALRFIPAEKLADEGYQDFVKLFQAQGK